MLRGENLIRSSFRIAKEYGLTFEKLFLNGVFPVNFPGRSDIAISVAAQNVAGLAKADGTEFSKFSWSLAPPRHLGANYLVMIRHWNRVSRSRDFLD